MDSEESYGLLRRARRAKNLAPNHHKTQILHGVYREPLRSAQGDSAKSESVQNDRKGIQLIWYYRPFS